MPSHLRPQEPDSAPKVPSGAPSTPRFTPGPASEVEGAGPKRFRTTGHKPAHRWSAILFAGVFVAIAAVAIVWLFVAPRPGGGGFFPGGPTTGEQASSLTADGATWELTSDLGTPVELSDVSDEGVAVRFLPDPAYAFITVHVVSCEVNGEAHDPTDATDPLRYTVVNESTGESVSTLDPYFITSGTGQGTTGTIVVVKVEGLSADQYDSVVLGLDESFAEGDVTSGNYTTTDESGLAVNVTKAD